MEQITLFNEAFEKYYQLIHRRINSMVGNTDTADELTQETFSRLVSHIDEMHDIDHTRKWLLTVATNLTRDFIEKNNRMTLFADASELFGNNAPSTNPNNVQNMMAAELLHDVLAYIHSWDDRSQFIFISKIKGRTSKDIAKELQCSTSSVDGKFQRLRNRINQRYSNQWRALYHEK